MPIPIISPRGKVDKEVLRIRVLGDGFCVTKMILLCNQLRGEFLCTGK